MASLIVNYPILMGLIYVDQFKKAVLDFLFYNSQILKGYQGVHQVGVILRLISSGLLIIYLDCVLSALVLFLRRAFL
jgi:hypothetical protein